MAGPSWTVAEMQARDLFADERQCSSSSVCR
jgi:hypothetical protein